MALTSHPQVKELLNRYEHLSPRDQLALKALSIFFAFVVTS